MLVVLWTQVTGEGPVVRSCQHGIKVSGFLTSWVTISCSIIGQTFFLYQSILCLRVRYIPLSTFQMIQQNKLVTASVAIFLMVYRVVNFSSLHYHLNNYSYNNWLLINEHVKSYTNIKCIIIHVSNESTFRKLNDPAPLNSWAGDLT
jgi:hypothetical protein